MKTMPETRIDPTKALAEEPVDLKISQVVDVPNMLVSAFLPQDIFERLPGRV